MDDTPRHQCVIYAGAPSHHLPSQARVILQKLGDGYRCLYLNSPPMVAGLRSVLSALEMNVAHEVAVGRLILSSAQDHLVDNVFDPDRMLQLLKETFEQAIADGFVGLWASGDMAWEFGPANDFAKLLDYERKLESFLQANPTMCGICQYHVDLLPKDVAQTALVTHRAIHVNEMLTRVNTCYTPPGAQLPTAAALNDTLEQNVANREARRA